MMRFVFLLIISLSILSSCGPSRPHLRDHKALVLQDDSIQAENKKLMAELEKICSPFDVFFDTTGSPRPEKHKNIILQKTFIVELCQYLRNIQAELLANVDEISISEANMMSLKNLKHPKNTDIPGHYFIGSDPEQVEGKAKEIKEHIYTFKGGVDTFTGGKLKDLLNSSLNVSDTTTEYDQKMKSWEAATFWGANAAEAYVILDKLQNAVLKTGLLSIKSLIEPVAIPES